MLRLIEIVTVIMLITQIVIPWVFGKQKWWLFRKKFWYSPISELEDEIDINEFERRKLLEEAEELEKKMEAKLEKAKELQNKLK